MKRLIYYWYESLLCLVWGIMQRSFRRTFFKYNSLSGPEMRGERIKKRVLPAGDFARCFLKVLSWTADRYLSIDRRFRSMITKQRILPGCNMQANLDRPLKATFETVRRRAWVFINTSLYIFSYSVSVKINNYYYMQLLARVYYLHTECLLYFRQFEFLLKKKFDSFSMLMLIILKNNYWLLIIWNKVQLCNLQVTSLNSV